MKKAYSSAEIIEGFRKNDEEIISITYNSCFGFVSDYIKKNSGSKVDAEDVMQEAMIYFFRKSRKLSFETEYHPFTFIVNTGKYLWQNKLKNNNYNNRQFSLDLIDEEKIPELHEELDYKDQIRKKEKLHEARKKIYKACYLKLNTDCRKIIALTIEGKNNEEIKTAMNFANDNITIEKKRRCKQKLLDLISIHPKYKELNNEY